jgi:hypothetical protein
VADAKNKNLKTGHADANALKRFVESTPDDLWVTFHDGRLWWARLKGTPVCEDDVSKYREVEGGWRCQPFSGGNDLLCDLLPGRITKTQGFQATICSFGEKDLLVRILTGQSSTERTNIETAYEKLVTAVASSIANLHWKDFELLVDLLFRQSGWRRVGLAGETVKDVDLVLSCPMTKALIGVQVKSEASLATARHYQKIASREKFKEFFFAVHSPADDLQRHWNDFKTYEDEPFRFTLLGLQDLAERAVDAGLAAWVRDRTF